MSTKIFRIFGILYLAAAHIIINFQPCFGQTKVDKIDELVNRYYDIGKFNGCILVAENRKITYQNALGFTDAEQNEKLTLDHNFRLASVSKQFTAMAIMMLQEQGKLNYDDNLWLYIPELPYWHINIRHLLTHTSGLPDYTSLLEEFWDLANKSSPERKVTSNMDALKLIVQKQPPVKFHPGDRHEYCNTGYMVLALIVERVSGERFQDFMKRYIFQPLEMNHTYVNEPTGILPEIQRAHGFKPNPEGSGFIFDDHHYQNGMYGDGGIITTIKDMMKWDQALSTNKLVRKTTLDAALAPAVLNDLSSVNYGFGWSIIPGENGTVVAHGGGWLGFRAFILRDITNHHTVIQLCNMPGIHKGELAFAINDILHDREYTLPVKTQITFQVDMRIPLQHQIFNPLNGDRVVLRGNFNGWSGNTAVLTDSKMDSVYEITQEISGFTGDAIQYKFVIHKSGGTDVWEENPDPSNPDYGNRKIILMENPQTVPVVKFDLDKYSLDYRVEFTTRELQEDFQQMRNAIENMHPALYEFTDKTTYDALFETQFKLIDKPLPAQAFYRIAAPLIARIGCGHSAVYLPESWWGNAPERFLPLRLRFLHNKVYVWQIYGETGDIIPGSEVVSINGQPVVEIVEQLLSAIPADGYNHAYRMDRLGRRFSYLYALQYGFPDDFRIEYRLPGNEQLQSAVITPASEGTLAAANPRNSILTFNIVEKKNIAILAMNNFAYYDQHETFYHFIDSAFAEIDELKIKNLILDVRDNDGGDPFCAAHLLSYITPRPIPYFAEPYGKYAKLAEPISLADKRFAGSLFVLINGKCFSTTGHLCALLKFHNIGTFIGSETGGTFTCNDAKQIVHLKNTRIRLQVARGTFAVAVQGMPQNRGIMPDYPVEANIEDLPDSRDTTMKYTLSLIGKLE